MAKGRVLIVHESGGSRALMSELLSREGYHAEAVETTFRCMTRYVEEPADVVIIGLGGLRESELELIGALKKEAPGPRIVVTFPSPLRDLAVLALESGADAYMLEPFYSAELLLLVRGQLGFAGRGGGAGLVDLAGELAHAVKNPLQVISLSLADDKLQKRKLVEEVARQVERIRDALHLLEEHAEIRPVDTTRRDARDVARRAAERASTEGVTFTVEAGDPVIARADDENLPAALAALFSAIAARAGGDGDFPVRLGAAGGSVTLSVEAPRDLFADEHPDDLLRRLFVVRSDREIVPGFAHARALLATLRGSLQIHEDGDRWLLEIRLPA